MIGLLRHLLRLRGPLGVVALAVGVGVFTGLVATNVVLAAWTYRDAARRDLRAPGRWALAVLVASPVAFPAYVAVQRATDWSDESRVFGAVRRVKARRDRAGEAVPIEAESSGGRDSPGAGDGGSDAAGDDGSSGSGDGSVGDREGRRVGRAVHGGSSLATTAAKYGVRAARRGGRWAAGRARRRLAK